LAGTIPGSLTALLANALLLEPYTNMDPLLLVSWSLVFEVGFYLLVALGFALWLAGINRWLLFGMAFALAIAGLLGAHLGPFFVLKFWPEFLCGSAIFLALWMRGRHRLCGVFLAVPPLFALLAFLASDDTHRMVQMTGAALFALVLWALYPHDQYLAEQPGLRWLAKAGGISYSLYLVHAFTGGRAVSLLSRLIAHDSPAYLLVQIVGWLVAVAVAVGFHRMCEQPLERWRRQLFHATS